MGVVADGVTVSVHFPTSPAADIGYALKYNLFSGNTAATWISEGFFFVKHATEIGGDLQLFVDFSPSHNAPIQE